MYEGAIIAPDPTLLNSTSLVESHRAPLHTLLQIMDRTINIGLHSALADRSFGCQDDMHGFGFNVVGGV